MISNPLTQVAPEARRSNATDTQGREAGKTGSQGSRRENRIGALKDSFQEQT